MTCKLFMIRIGVSRCVVTVKHADCDLLFHVVTGKFWRKRRTWLTAIATSPLIWGSCMRLPRLKKLWRWTSETHIITYQLNEWCRMTDWDSSETFVTLTSDWHRSTQRWKIMCTSEGRLGCLDDSSTCTCRSSNQRPVAAFIIFNDDSVALNILREYNSISWIRYILGGHRFRMNTVRDKQQYSLHVKAAPDPSSIIWENLKYTNVSHVRSCWVL